MLVQKLTSDQASCGINLYSLDEFHFWMIIDWSLIIIYVIDNFNVHHL